MGFPKAFFIKDIEELSSFSRALSLPVRISILKIMLERATWVSSEEFARLDLTIVTRDRHLRALTELKLVENIHQKGLTYHRINKPVFSKMVSDFNHFFDLYKTDSSTTFNEE